MAEGIELPDSPTLPAVVLDCVQRPELEPRATARFLWRAAVRQVPLDGAFEVEAQLVVQIVLGRVPPEQGAQAEANVVQHRRLRGRRRRRNGGDSWKVGWAVSDADRRRHPGYPASSTWPTAVVRARQAWTSDSSCPSPLGVNR